MKTKLSIFFIGVFVFLGIFIISGSTHAQHDSNDSLSITTNGKPIIFKLTGAKGTFESSQPAYYAVHIKGNRKATIQFAASALSYVGPYQEQAELDVVYQVVNDGKTLSLSPRQSLVLKRSKGFHEFLLQGQVTIYAIEAQPAGDYKGNITITVFEK